MARIFLLIFAASIFFSIQPLSRTSAQKERPRAIVSDDFTKARPRSKRRVKSGHSGKSSRTYHLASTPLAKPIDKSATHTLQVGLTVWKLQLADRAQRRNFYKPSWIARRVAADTVFREGDLLRFSIESPRAGYLYVIDRDCFGDGSYGETNLIFPARGEDNRLEAGKLIDIPAGDEAPFKTSPKSNQTGELLTIIVTSAPLPLALSKDPLPISITQLAEWERSWSGLTERFEMDGGIGQAQTREEHLAASTRGTRQLTRDDPGPQTIYFLTPRNNDGLLFNLMLSYVR